MFIYLFFALVPSHAATRSRKRVLFTWELNDREIHSGRGR